MTRYLQNAVVVSKDGMTADCAKIDHKILAAISKKILNSVEVGNRVLYDISTTPPPPSYNGNK